MKIAVIGAGRIGLAVAKLLRKGGHTVRIWDKDASRMRPRMAIAEAVSGAQFVFLCVPSWGLREVLRGMRSHSSARQIFIAFTKGIEKNTGMFPYDVLRAEFPKNDCAVIGGPFLAEELNRALYGVGVVGTPKRSVFLKIEKIFRGTPAKFVHSSDARGVSVAGVLKNIYAVGLGIADGLMWGENAKGWLSAELGEEMVRAGVFLGAKRETMARAGMADFLASGWSPYSRNRGTGEAILRHRMKSTASEGIASYPSARVLLAPKARLFPYFSHLAAVVGGRENARLVFEKFLR